MIKADLSSEREKKFLRMTTEPVQKIIIKLAIPTIISMLITSFYNMADTYFVGKIGSGESEVVKAALQTRATAAVGVVFSLMAIIQAFGFFFGHGSGNFISRALGHHDTKDAERIASCGFFYALIIGTVIMVLGQIFAGPLATLLGATEEFKEYTIDYMRIILLGAPIIMAAIVLNNQIRFQGNALFAMVGIASGGVLNLILDPIFIFSFNMEVKGAAFATVISQLVSLVLLFIGTERSDCIKIRFKNLRFDRHSIGKISKGGVPSLCRQGLGSISTACLNHSAAVYGALAVTTSVADPSASAVAAMSVVSRIMMFASSALIGFGQGFQPVCGYNYGAEKYERVKKAFFFCVKFAFGFLLAIAIPVSIFAEDIVSLFRGNDAFALEVGTRALRFQCLIFPIMSWVIMSNMMLQTIGKAFKASLLAMARNGIMFIPAVLILPKIFGLTGVEMAQAVADALSLILAIPITVSVLKELTVAQNSKKQEQSD